MVNEVCATCKYFEEQRSICRFHPPTVTALVMAEEYHNDDGSTSTRDTIVVRSNFPTTDDDDWCREWKSGLE